MTLGEFIKQYRAEHGLSKRAFAMMADISVQQVSNIERGLGYSVILAQKNKARQFYQNYRALMADRVGFEL